MVDEVQVERRGRDRVEARSVVRTEDVGRRQREFVEEVQEFGTEGEVGAGDGEKRNGLRTGRCEVGVEEGGSERV